MNPVIDNLNFVRGNIEGNKLVSDESTDRDNFSRSRKVVRQDMTCIQKCALAIGIVEGRKVVACNSLLKMATRPEILRIWRIDLGN